MPARLTRRYWSDRRSPDEACPATDAPDADERPGDRMEPSFQGATRETAPPGATAGGRNLRSRRPPDGQRAQERQRAEGIFIPGPPGRQVHREGQQPEGTFIPEGHQGARFRREGQQPEGIFISGVVSRSRGGGSCEPTSVVSQGRGAGACGPTPEAMIMGIPLNCGSPWVRPPTWRRGRPEPLAAEGMFIPRGSPPRAQGSPGAGGWGSDGWEQGAPRAGGWRNERSVQAAAARVRASRKRAGCERNAHSGYPPHSKAGGRTSGTALEPR